MFCYSCVLSSFFSSILHAFTQNLLWQPVQTGKFVLRKRDLGCAISDKMEINQKSKFWKCSKLLKSAALLKSYCAILQAQTRTWNTRKAWTCAACKNASVRKCALGSERSVREWETLVYTWISMRETEVREVEMRIARHKIAWQRLRNLI